MPGSPGGRGSKSFPEANASRDCRRAISPLMSAACGLTAMLCLLMAGSSAFARCACSGPSGPEPAVETGAKLLLAGGVVAFAAYRYYRRRSPRG
jgi:hypothetical protein